MVDELHLHSFWTRHMAGESHWTSWIPARTPADSRVMVTIELLAMVTWTGRLIDYSLIHS